MRTRRAYALALSLVLMVAGCDEGPAAPSNRPPEPPRPYPWDRPCSSWEAMRRGQWFEAQAEYLRRHGLLTRSEAEYLKLHPQLLAPVPAIESQQR